MTLVSRVMPWTGRPSMNCSTDRHAFAHLLAGRSLRLGDATRLAWSADSQFCLEIAWPKYTTCPFLNGQGVRILGNASPAFFKIDPLTQSSACTGLGFGRLNMRTHGSGGLWLEF